MCNVIYICVVYPAVFRVTKQTFTCHFLYLLCNCFRWAPLPHWLSSTLSSQNKQAHKPGIYRLGQDCTTAKCTVTMATESRARLQLQLFNMKSNCLIVCHSFIILTISKWNLTKQITKCIQLILLFLQLLNCACASGSGIGRALLRHQNALPSWEHQAQ